MNGRRALSFHVDTEVNTVVIFLLSCLLVICSLHAFIFLINKLIFYFTSPKGTGKSAFSPVAYVYHRLSQNEQENFLTETSAVGAGQGPRLVVNSISPASREILQFSRKSMPPVSLARVFCGPTCVPMSVLLRQLFLTLGS